MKILIVDDDRMVLAVTSEVLRALTHETETCTSGRDALQKLAESESAFDLLLLDDTMPDISGRETVAELASRGIRIPVVICSGQPVKLNGYSARPGFDPVAFLTKPFTIQTLRTLIASLANNPDRG